MSGEKKEGGGGGGVGGLGEEVLVFVKREK